MGTTEEAITALNEAELYRRKAGEFGRELATRMALDSRTSPGIFTDLIMQSLPYFMLLH
jgi:hypothetical protein